MLGGAQWWSCSLQVLIEVVLFSLGALVAEVVLCSSFSVWSRLMPAPSDFAKQQVSILQRILVLITKNTNSKYKENTKQNTRQQNRKETDAFNIPSFRISSFF